MSDESTTFFEKPVYPIIFMVLLTIIFVGILSVFYRSTEQEIESRKKQAYQTQIISMFADTLATLTGKDKNSFTQIAGIQTNFPKYITEVTHPQTNWVTISRKYYTASATPGKIIGYCFDVTGSGLWGTMHGLLAVTPDFKEIINFSIYDNMETPGLGARVSEPWFKNQFAGKPLYQNNKPTSFTMIPEEGNPDPTQVKQITGATITSSSVLKIIQAAAGELAQMKGQTKL